MLSPKQPGWRVAAIIASDFSVLLLEKGLKPEQIDSAQALGEQISILTEARIAAELGAKAMHDVTEGGIYGALYEVAEASGVGFEV